MIEIIRNTTMFGKRSKETPFKAIVRNAEYIGTLNVCVNDVLAYGKTSADARLNVQSVLEAGYAASQAQMVFRIAKDRTVYCARWTGKDTMEYHIVRNGAAYHPICMGRCEIALQTYMDKVVADYDACTESRHEAEEK